MIEVEIMDDDSEPREFSEAIRELRKKVVLQEKGNVTLNVKTHLDDMVSGIDVPRREDTSHNFVLEENRHRPKTLLLHGNRRNAI